MLRKMFCLPIFTNITIIVYISGSCACGWAGELWPRSLAMSPWDHPPCWGNGTGQHVLPGDADAHGESPALQAHFNPLLVPS